jgi:hypothetical protein
MNTFLNEKFKVLLQEFGKPTYRALGLIVHQIVTTVTEKVPYDELFTKEN